MWKFKANFYMQHGTNEKGIAKKGHICQICKYFVANISLDISKKICRRYCKFFLWRTDWRMTDGQTEKRKNAFLFPSAFFKKSGGLQIWFFIYFLRYKLKLSCSHHRTAVIGADFCVSLCYSYRLGRKLDSTHYTGGSRRARHHHRNTGAHLQAQTGTLENTDV